jgi:hypothetical protein
MLDVYRQATDHHTGRLGYHADENFTAGPVPVV